MSDKIKCLAVRQPWAWAIVMGFKDIENRSWTTKYRGPVVIHASTSKTMVNTILKNSSAQVPAKKFPFGALIGIADLVDIIPMSPELEFNPWAWGPNCWRMANPRFFKKPIPAKGMLNLYSLPASLAEKAKQAISIAQPAKPNSDDKAWEKTMINLEDEKERLLGLISSYWKLEDFTNALRLCDRSVSAFDDIDSYINRSALNWSFSRISEALQDANVAISKDPSSARAYYIRHLVYQDMGNEKLAQEDLDKAIKLDPSYAENTD